MQVCVTRWLFLCDCAITIHPVAWVVGRSARLGKILRIPLAKCPAEPERLPVGCCRRSQLLRYGHNNPGACKPSAFNESRARESVAWHSCQPAWHSLTFDSADHDSQAVARRPFILHEFIILVLARPRTFPFRMSDSLLLKLSDGNKATDRRRWNNRENIQEPSPRAVGQRSPISPSPRLLAQSWKDCSSKTLPACCLSSNRQDPISPPFTVEDLRETRRSTANVRDTGVHESGRGPHRAIQMDPGCRR